MPRQKDGLPVNSLSGCVRPRSPEGGEDGTISKKAAKKAEAKAKKEAEKARRAAERAAAAAASGSQAQTEDLAKDNYGQETHETKLSPDVVEINLKTLGEEHVGKKVELRAWIQNARMQSAKIAFVELREEGNWSIQDVVAASPEGTPVSRPMVKWVGSINPESFVVVEGTVQKPLEPVKSCRVSNYELHITKCFIHPAAPAVLGMTLAAANRPIANFSDEDVPVDQGVEKLSIASAGEPAGIPAASMLTHLDNIVIHKRSVVQQVIADIRAEMKELYRFYLRYHGFKEFQPPCLIAAASEGGANVFRLPYFEKDAYFAQSPQFYKQIEIAGGRKSVFSIGPVFRAENSNTPRHMTEFTGLDMEMEIKKDYREVLTSSFTCSGTSKERCADEIALVRSVYPSEEFLLPEPGKEVRLTFAEGQKLLREEGPEEFRNKYNTDFYVLDKFPESARPFYAKEDPTNRKVTNAYDLFMRDQEICSEAAYQRPGRAGGADPHQGIDPASPGIKEDVDIFRGGVPAHGGGGIGLDRVVPWYLNLPSVHLAAFYPRTPKRLLP
ncbi:aspartate--tRNA ligase, cytoplasmic [Achaetomium macrosporum]|uniref:aspartate--tRNA ligase n=1 Tax=Achaetomium macrosporum TaxID=79813 RepID=A0AAN7H7T0_9PEZI|nr:aspartate--tRNA ligase, cytoplasmic [Achaetomium macrosporum]